MANNNMTVNNRNFENPANVIPVSHRTVMQNNSKSHNVCKFENIENLESYIEVRGINFENFEKNSFSCDISFYPTRNTYTLLSQKNGFSLKVVDNKFHFIFADGTDIEAVNLYPEQGVPEITKKVGIVYSFHTMETK